MGRDDGAHCAPGGAVIHAELEAGTVGRASVVHAAAALMALLRTQMALALVLCVGADRPTVTRGHISEWTVADVHDWLSELKLEAVAGEAERDRVDGRAAQGMDKQDWRDLGASGLKAARIVGAIKALRDEPTRSNELASQRPSPTSPRVGTKDLGGSCRRSRTATVLTTVGDGSRTESIELPAALIGEETDTCEAPSSPDALPAPTAPSEAGHFFQNLRNATLADDWPTVARAHAALQQRCAAAIVSRAQLQDSLDEALLLLQTCGFVRVEGAFPQSRRFLRRQKSGALDLARLTRALDKRWPDGKPPLSGYGPLVNILRGNGRFELSFPFEPPFNETSLVSPPLLIDLVKAYLGNADQPPLKVPIRLDQAGCIVTQPHAALQEAHWDHPAVHDIHRSAEESERELIKQVPTPTLRQIISGHRGYSIKMTVPLVPVTPDLGPIHVCAGSHREELRVLDVVSRSDDALAGYLRRHCSTTLLGVGNVGDALLYDPRILHWGGNIDAEERRPVVDLQYVQSWVPPEFSYRPLTDAGRQQADHFRSIEY